MKIKLTMEIDFPNLEEEEGENLQEEIHEGITLEMAHVNQIIFDKFVHYAVCQHFEEALKWQCLHAESGKETERIISEVHELWGKILKASEESVVIEKIQ